MHGNYDYENFLATLPLHSYVAAFSPDNYEADLTKNFEDLTSGDYREPTQTRHDATITRPERRRQRNDQYLAVPG